MNDALYLSKLQAMEEWCLLMATTLEQESRARGARGDTEGAKAAMTAAMKWEDLGGYARGWKRSMQLRCPGQTYLVVD